MLKDWICSKLKRCSCFKHATWVFAPTSSITNNYYCDDCVPRECTCNYEYIDTNYLSGKHTLGDIYDVHLNEPKDENHKWINEYSWIHTDDQGRPYPCVEFFHIDG